MQSGKLYKKEMVFRLLNKKINKKMEEIFLKFIKVQKTTIL